MLRTLPSHQVAFDVVVAVLCVLLRVLISVDEWAMYAVILLMAAALALRRLGPPLALGVAWVGAAVQLAFGLGPDVSNLAILPVLYATAAYGQPRTKWAGLISAGAGAIIAASYLTVYRFYQGWVIGDISGGIAGGIPRFLTNLAFLLGVLLATFALSWTLGLLARTRHAARESRAAQLVAEAEETRARQDVIVEQERNRIARDMHDVVAHSLAVVIAQADGARYAQERDPGSTVTALTAISSTAREALSDVRVLLGQLRHNQGESPQPVLADLDRLIDQLRSSGLTIAWSESGTPTPLGTSQQLAIYRIVQEALTNALRHGDADDEVLLGFEWTPDGVELSVSNALLAAPAPAAVAGHGLVGMRERAALVGG
ncbi:MAG TPA: histidine kinase, partial [Homoserinimonas sp.]|nr:histidine kinase [Homoserinimonas sp.]